MRKKRGVAVHLGVLLIFLFTGLVGSAPLAQARRKTKRAKKRSASRKKKYRRVRKKRRRRRRIPKKCRRIKNRRKKRRCIAYYRKKKKRKKRRPRFPPIPLYHIHTNEYVRLSLYDRRGRIRGKALHQFSRFMKSYKTGKVKQIHWRVPVVLYEVWMHFGQPQVTVYSGYRPPSVCNLKTSKHTVGEAVDFSLDGVSNAEIRDYLLKHWFMVGVGYYPNSYHVHLDVRKKKTFWIDYGGPGESTMYARRPYRDIKRGVAKRGYVPPRYRKKQTKKEVERLRRALSRVEAAKKKKAQLKESAAKEKETAKRRGEKKRSANKKKRSRSRKPKSEAIQLADSTPE